MLLQCIGVVNGCCCKEVYRFPHNITYLLHLYIFTLFLQQHPYFVVHLKSFFVLLYLHTHESYNTTAYFSVRLP